MNTHEFQAKEILRSYGIDSAPFGVAKTRDEVKKIIKDMHLQEAVVKIQVHAGGRGKAGGVKFAKSPQEIEEVAAKLLGMKMVNNQTGPLGIVAHQVMISKPVDIAKEFYLGAVIDRASSSPILIGSSEGGMEIEEIAVHSPDKICKIPIQLDGSVKSYHLVRLAKAMGWQGQVLKDGIDFAKRIAKAFIDLDAAILEINPLVLTPHDKFIALDAKLSIDDDALFRHKDLGACFDPTQLLESEVKAKIFDLAYIALDGNIGCMVNGAGLAMATMDIIHHFGGNPANFLDVGGGASKEKVAEGFKIILSDPQVKVILVNIFGGILNCATLAEGIVAAAKELAIAADLIVRMEGTNVAQGKKILKESGLKIIAIDDLTDAAKKAVECARG